MNRPGVQYVKSILDNRHILNYSYTGKDDENIYDIFGQDIATIREQKLHKLQSQIPRLAVVDMLNELKQIHKKY